MDNYNELQAIIDFGELLFFDEEDDGSYTVITCRHVNHYLSWFKSVFVYI